jgi:hypothetical protein
MLTDFIGLIGVLVFFAIGLLVLRQAEQRRLTASLVPYRLQFPTDLEPDAVAAFLSSLSGLLPSWRVRMLSRPAIVLEITATAGRIRHHLLVPRGVSSRVLDQLHAALPGVLAYGDPDHRPFRAALAGELALSSLLRPLRTDQPASASAAILASLSGLRSHEAAVVQWIVTPSSPPKPVTTGSTNRPSGLAAWLRNIPVGHVPAVEPREARDKGSSPKFWAVGRLGVVAVPARARTILSGLTGIFSVTNAPGVHFRRRAVPSIEVSRRLAARTLPLVSWPALLNARESAIVLGFPLGGPNVPELDLRDRPLLPPSDLIARRGRVVAQGNFPGRERPLAQDLEGVLRHTLLLGPTGTGKSYALAGMVLDDIGAGDGRAVIVIDAKADLVETVLDRLPADRASDVAVLDPSSHRLLGLNPLAQAQRAPELVADQVFGVLRRLWGLQSAPRTSDLLHASLLTLCHSSGAVLPDLAPLLLDAGFRRRLTAPHASDLALGPFWSSYQALSDGERAQVVAPLLTRLRQFLLRPSLRAVLGQANPGLGLADVMAQGKVLLVPLAAGRLGQEAASLLGALLVAELWTTTQARAGMPPAQRRPVSVFIDEWQTVEHLPTPLEEVLAQSRGYGVGYTLANQHLGQLPASLREAALANVRSKICFALPSADAAAMAKLFGLPVTAGDLERLGRYEVMVRLAAGATLAPPTTGQTLPLPPVTGQGDAIRHSSAARYGRDRQDVEAELRQRQTPDGPGPLGKRRRS